MEEIKSDWRDIFRAFRMAFDPKKVILGVGGVIASLVLFIVLISVFKHFGYVDIGPAEIINGAFFSSNLCPYDMLLSFFQSMMVFSTGKLIVSLCLVAGLLIIWSVAGGAITRIAAMEYAKDESLRLGDALRFSVKKFWSYFWSPIVPVIGVLFFALCNVLGGFVGKFGGFGDIFVALGFPLALVSSFMIAFVGIVGIIGLCLMFPTISAEGSDAFDAMSRAYSYVLSKPRRYFIYFFLSVVTGVISVIFVGLVANFVINITFDTVSIGMGRKFLDVVEAVNIKPDYCSIIGANLSEFITGFSTLNGFSEKSLAGSVLICLLAIKTVICGFAFSYFGSVKTIVYFLMRKDVDETGISDVYVEDALDADESGNSVKASNEIDDYVS